MKMKENTPENVYKELPGLFFETRQIIRQTLPGPSLADPNEWVRLETMRYIETAGRPTMHEVASYLRIKAPSATSLIAYLVEHGLVTRETGEDRRVVRLSVTEKGKESLKQYMNGSEGMMRHAFSTLEESEVCTLSNLLKKLISGHAAKQERHE